MLLYFKGMKINGIKGEKESLKSIFLFLRIRSHACVRFLFIIFNIFFYMCLFTNSYFCLVMHEDSFLRTILNISLFKNMMIILKMKENSIIFGAIEGDNNEINIYAIRVCYKIYSRKLFINLLTFFFYFTIGKGP